MPDQATRPYIRSFQGLRGFAIVLIFLSHCKICIGDSDLSISAWYGALGVCMFTVLSGYLLALRYAGKDIDIRAYVKKKLKRFYPLHLVTLLAAIPFCLGSLLALDKTSWLGLVCNLLLVQAWVPTPLIYFSMNGVAWYLSLDMFFGIVGPWLLKQAEKLPRRWLIPGIACVLGIQFLWTGLTWQMPEARWLIYIFPVARLLDLLLGILLCLLHTGRQEQEKLEPGQWAAALSLAVLGLLMGLSLPLNSEWFSVCAWTVPVCVLISVLGEHDEAPSRWLNGLFQNRWIQYIGSVSFELFLIHSLCIRYCRAVCLRLGVSIVYGFLPAFLLSLLAAELWRRITKKYALPG